MLVTCKEERISKASGTSKLFFIKAENIAIAPNQNEFKKYGEALKFALTFPALPNGTKKFTLCIF